MFITALAFVLMPVSQTASTDIARSEQARLNACIEQIDVDPEEYEESLDWLSKGARPAARYCNGLALLGLGNYEQGAIRLEELANAPDAGSLPDRAIYLAQSGNAWLSAGYPDAAITTLTNALKIAPNEPDIIKDRASAWLALGSWEEGIADLDSALAIFDRDDEAYRLRAHANLQLENLEAARADIEQALAINGTNIETLVLRGDIREATRLASGDVN